MRSKLLILLTLLPALCWGQTYMLTTTNATGLFTQKHATSHSPAGNDSIDGTYATDAEVIASTSGVYSAAAIGWAAGDTAVSNWTAGAMVPQTRTVTINGEAGALSSNLAFTVSSGGGDVHTTSNNTFSGGTTQSFDSATVTNLGMRGGNIDLGSGKLVGGGGTEGVSVNASGNLTMSGQFTSTGDQKYNAVNLYGYSTNFAVAPYFSGFMAGGTLASPSSMLADKTMFYLSGRGHTGAAFSGSRAAMYFTSAENWTTNANGAYIWFQVTPTGSVSPQTALRIDHNRAVRLYNMTTGPTLASGYGVIAASNSIMNVWPGTGTTALKVNGNLDMADNNIALGSGWLSGDGDSEGVSVDSSGNVTLSRNATAYGNYIQETYAVAPNYLAKRADGNISSPTNVAAGQVLGGFLAFGYDGAGFTATPRAALQFQTAEAWDTNKHGTRLLIETTPKGATARAASLTVENNRAMRLYNMPDAPVTGSGYIVHGASNNVAYVWNGAGVRTQLTSHNERNELAKIDYDAYTGIGTEINLQYMAEVLDQMLPKDHKYKGKLITRTTNETAIADWRANEARQAAERAAEIAAWEQADAQYKAELVKCQAIPMADKARLTQPTKEDDRPKPEPYQTRPIPTWAAEAQRKFDVKWGAEK